MQVYCWKLERWYHSTVHLYAEHRTPVGYLQREFEVQEMHTHLVLTSDVECQVYLRVVVKSHPLLL